MTADDLISRLDGTRKTGEGKWIARCPAHDDRSPSLSVRETNDGTILIKCFAGCETLSICRSVGIEIRDLFPNKYVRRVDRSEVPRLTAAERLELAEHEITVAAFIVDEITRTRTATDEQWTRLAQCSERIGRARNA